MTADGPANDADHGTLTVPQGTALSVGAVLGSGVLSLPALAAAEAGPASLVSWLALILLSAPLAWTFAALGARIPDSGGVSTFVRAAFGPWPAAVVGWCFYLAVPLGAPAVTAFAGAYLADILGGGHLTALATFVSVLVIVFLMNWFGLRVSGRLQLVLSGILATLMTITVLTAAPHARVANLHPFLPHGWTGVGSAAALLVWGFSGWEAVSSLSAGYRNPRRDIPRVAFLAVLLVGVLYLALAAMSVLVLGPRLPTSAAPLADLLAIGLGGPARAVTATVAFLLTIGAVNAFFAGATQLGTALARDRSFPRVLSGTPRRSLLFVTAAASVAQVLPISLTGKVLLVTGCFTLVYVLGMAAGVRLLPRGWPRRGAVVALAAVLGLLYLVGLPALLSLGIAAAAILYRVVDRRPGRG